MATDAAEIWRQCFANWPPQMERRGVLVTTFNEQIPFESFAASHDLLLIERRTPDTIGARSVIIDYRNILAVKIVDIVKAKAFESLGFVTHAPRK